MMRTQQPAGCNPRAGWFLAAVAAVIILVQARWLHSLNTCSAATAAMRAHADQQHLLLLANASAPPPSAMTSDSALLATASRGGDALVAQSVPAVAAPLGAAAHAAARAAPGAAVLPANATAGAAVLPAVAAASAAAVCVRQKPRLMVVTAEQPTECSTAAAQWLGARAMRNRLQYAQAHGYSLYWNTNSVDPEYAGIKESGMWNKPALLSKLLHSNITAGVEWLLWIDSDAIFMDMDFELPLDEYEEKGYNLVLWGEPRKVDTVAEQAPDYFGINAGVLLLRNNDWTRAFMARILDAGNDIAGSTAVQGAALKGMCDRAYDCVVSDQSTIVYLLYTQPELWRKQTLLEKRFALNGHWQQYVGHLVPGSLKLDNSIWGSDRVPFVMHFAGCQLCSGRTDSHYANWGECRDAMAQALNHVEDWGLSQLGLRHTNLTSLDVVHADGPPTYPEAPPPPLGPPPEPPAAVADAHGMDAAQGGGAEDGDYDDDAVAASSAAADKELAALAQLQPPPSLP